MAKAARTGYLTDVSEEEWAFVLPYLLLSRVDSRARGHDLRATFNAVRYIVKGGNQWRLMPHDLPPWQAAYQQMRRWMAAGCFELIVADVQSLLREFGGRKGQPRAVCIDSRTLQSTPESGARAGYDGAKRRKGSKVHIAVDTLGHLIALTVTPADQGGRSQVEALAQQMQQITGNMVELAYVDQGYTGPAAAAHGIPLEVVKHPWPGADSSCCHADGSANEASPGRPASEDSPVTTNGSTPTSKDSTISPSPVSCSPKCSSYSTPKAITASSTPPEAKSPERCYASGENA